MSSVKTTKTPECYLDAKGVLRSVKTNKPACLRCGKSMSVRHSSTFGKTKEEVLARLPDGAVLTSNEPEQAGYYYAVSYIHPEAPWGKEGGMFCRGRCAIEFAIVTASKQGFVAAFGPNVPERNKK